VAGYTKIGQSENHNKPPFDVITDFITFGGAAFETLAVGSIFIFRSRHREEISKLPYRCPLYPVVPTIFIVCMVAVMTNMFLTPSARHEAFVGVGFIATGAIIYLVAFSKIGYGRPISTSHPIERQ
jgi:basic amino acid/polyamine antiporter, APA family